MKGTILRLALYYVQIKVNLWLNIRCLKMKHRFLLQKYKLYLPSEEELLRELNQEYQALESSKTVGEDIGSEKEEGRY